MRYKHRAERAEIAERYFRCARCGARGEVSFRAEGSSGWVHERDHGANAPYVAHAAAQDALMEDTDRTLGLVRCPTCGERDRWTVRWAAIRVALWLGCAITALLVFDLVTRVYAVGFFVAMTGVQLWRELARRSRADRAMIVKLTPGKLAVPEPKPPRPARPAARVAPPIPGARVVTAPPPPAPEPRRPEDGPAFLHEET